MLKKVVPFSRVSDYQVVSFWMSSGGCSISLNDKQCSYLSTRPCSLSDVNLKLSRILACFPIALFR